MSANAERGKYTTPEGSKTWEYLTVFTCSIMSMCVGFVLGWNSPSIMKLMAPDSPIPITTFESSTLIALVCVGYMSGSPLGIFMIDRIGRKNSILISTLPVIIGWCLIMIATNVWFLYLSRFAAGLTVSLFFSILPIYIGESASLATRGAGMAVGLFMFNVGIIVAFIFVPYLSISMMAGVFLAVTVGFVALFWFMPDSPYYLMMKGRKDEAEEVLEKLRGKADVTEEIEIILETLKTNEKSQRKVHLKELLTVRANRRAFTIIILLMLSQNFAGYFVFMMFAQLILKSTTNIISDYTAAIMIGVVQLFSAMITSFIVDKVGRKPLILFSGVVIAISNLVIGVFFYLKDYMNVDMSAYSLVAFVSAMLMVSAFNYGPFCLQLILQSEIFAIEIKMLGICFVNVMTGCANVIAVKTYALVAITWGYGNSPFFLTFFVVMVVCTAVVLHLLPETKGKSFVQIQKELND